MSNSPMTSAVGPAVRLPQLEVVGCQTTPDCFHRLQAAVCNTTSRTCICSAGHVAIDSFTCQKIAGYGEFCRSDAQCLARAVGTQCNVQLNVCQCHPSFTLDFQSDDDHFACIEKSGEPDDSFDMSLILVVGGLVLMFIIICVAFQLFTREQFGETRSIFNTQNSRLMNASFASRPTLSRTTSRKSRRQGASGTASSSTAERESTNPCQFQVSVDDGGSAARPNSNCSSRSADSAHNDSHVSYNGRVANISDDGDDDDKNNGTANTIQVAVSACDVSLPSRGHSASNSRKTVTYDFDRRKKSLSMRGPPSTRQLQFESDNSINRLTPANRWEHAKDLRPTVAAVDDSRLADASLTNRRRYISVREPAGTRSTAGRSEGMRRRNTAARSDRRNRIDLSKRSRAAASSTNASIKSGHSQLQSSRAISPHPGQQMPIVRSVSSRSDQQYRGNVVAARQVTQNRYKAGVRELRSTPT